MLPSFSWLPSLSSIDFALPASIQKRFISFALRQSLGHFLKPGQLDVQQVDSQIGSGYVQVRDLELDNEAINTIISGLPIRLHDGSVGKVTARIPLPNPLTSSVGLSLESLHLTFYIEPNVVPHSAHIFVDNLAESVASVAETFLHEELTPNEEATLRESIHLGSAQSNIFEENLPGGLDPFMSEDEVHFHDADPPGVSLFATLIERLLARFHFDASDTRITIVNPKEASFTIVIPEVRYGTEHPPDGSDNAPVTPSTETRPMGETRKVTITGITVTTRSLRPLSPHPFTPADMTTPSPKTVSPTTPVSMIPDSRMSTHSSEAASPPIPEPSSPYSESSDLDEETQLYMSQSIAALPPRSISPASSAASSMYQSAISTGEDAGLGAIPEEGPPDFPASSIAELGSPLLPPLMQDDYPSTTPQPPETEVISRSPVSSPKQQRRLTVRTIEIEDETILSLGSEPIELRLTTPHPSRPASAPKSSPSAGPSRSPDAQRPALPEGDSGPKRQDRVRVELTMGNIACALSAQQVRSVIDIADLWASHSSPVTPPDLRQSDDTSSLSLDDVDGAIRVRGVIILLLPSSRTSASNPDDALTEYFSRPLVPPQLPRGYTRVHIEGALCSLATRRADVPKGRRSTSRREPSSVSASFMVTDISAFAFLPRAGSAEMSAFPVLITDPHLPVQYSDAHIHPSHGTSSEPSPLLPTFGLSDWTDPDQASTSAKLSLWRTKLSQPVTGRSFAGEDENRMSSPFTASPSRRNMDLPKPSSPPTSHPIPLILPSSPGRLGLAGLSTPPGKGVHQMSKSATPALIIKFRSSRPEAGHSAGETQVSVAPLHVFLDTGLILARQADGKSEVLQFLDGLVTSTPSISGGAGDEPPFDDDFEGEYRPPTPRAHALRGLPDNKTERERERRRLERLVLEDLDLGYDYCRHDPEKTPTTPTGRQSGRRTRAKVDSPAIRIILPAIRVEARTRLPANMSSRSGAVVLDIHDFHVSPGGPEQDTAPTARFGTAEELYGGEASKQRSRTQDNVVLSASWKRLVVASSIVGQTMARAILSVGPLSHQDSSLASHIGTPPVREAPAQALRPQLTISKIPGVQAFSSHRNVGATAVSIDVPSVHAELSKPLIDGLQLWADDLTQLMEVAFAEATDSETDTQKARSGDSSLIGSRYFRASTAGSGTDSGGASLANTIRARQEQRSETAVKIAVTEAVVRLLVPRKESGQSVVRPFDMAASDVDVLVELKPEGKDETVVTVGVMDLNVYDTAPSGSNCFLSLTAPRSLNTTVRSALKLRFTSLVVPSTTVKESKIRLTVSGITYNFYPDLGWATALGNFFKAPPGAFESVVPSERTRVHVKVHDTSVRLYAPSNKGALVQYIGEMEFSTVVEGNSPTMSMSFSLPAFALLLIDDLTSNPDDSGTPGRTRNTSTSHGVPYWKGAGYALVAELSDLALAFKRDSSQVPPDSRLLIDQGEIRLHMCADTMGVFGAFIADFSSAFKQPNLDPPKPKAKREPARVSESTAPARSLLASLDEQAFKRLPEVGAAPDMIEDDLPTNIDYLDESFGAAAGLREIDDDEFGESDVESPVIAGFESVTSAHGGETIRMLRPEGLRITENYFETLPPDPGEAASFGDTSFQLRVRNFNANVFLYDGYDWIRTRKIIEEKAKEMRRRLAKIRQLVASGQTPDPSVEETNTNTLLFNSVYIGLEHNIDELEPGALIAAIDEELNEDFETNMQSSWQSLQPQPLVSPGHGGSHSTKAHRKRLRRSKGPSIEFRLMKLNADFDQYRPEAALVSRAFATVKDVEILDHVKTSTWRKFLTSLRADSRGNVRETDSTMVRIELRTLHPVPIHPSEEARLRAKILPLRLYVDQDALDFLKQFFAFKDPDAAPPESTEATDEIYFQQAEVFPVDIKLDYKPRRVDYRALRDGRTIELMNFFHFDGAEMTLRHITVKGITGWAKFFDLLNDLWTPDVKATQLVDVISGVSPIRSVVNVGSGVADLVLLPIAQYKKDGRVVRGLQKGTNSFIKSTAMEAIKLGARLATGTQVILEQAETVLGGQFKDEIMAEAVHVPTVMEMDDGELDEDPAELFSKYADQPVNVKDGMQSAYKSLKRNLNSAAQTILAVPMEVYERSGNEGAVRAVVRAVPIAVLRPMIGATEAVSKTLLGLQNTLDPNILQENEAKYKQR